MKDLILRNTTYKLPIYLPDATKGVTKGVDSIDLKQAGVEGVVVNTYHLMISPGTKALNEFGGIKNYMNFDGMVVSDSGGWQVFSLIHRNNGQGSVEDRGVVFSAGKKSRDIFTPERSIQVQFKIVPDVMICLDDFTPPESTKEQAEETVKRTVYWAKRSKKEYLRLIEQNNLSEKDRPHLYAVVQGGHHEDLRKRCAQELIDIGFDGYGYGGYVVNDDGEVDLELSRYICDLLPDDKPKFALGIGKPLDIVNLSQMGWDIFDCTLPTRDARHKRLYSLDGKPAKVDELKKPGMVSYIYIERKVFEHDQDPISQTCDCYTCRNYSKAYLRHLFKIEDTLAYRLATIHNIYVYSQVIELLRQN